MKRRTFLAMALPVSAYLAGCGTKPFYFIQMADTQLGMINGGEDGNGFSEETVIIEQVFSRINAMKPRPAFVTVCGDLTNTPGHDKQVAEYKRLVGLLDKKITVYNVSGNHDIIGTPGPSHEGLAGYRETFGPDWYTFNRGGWKFLVLNSTLMKTPESCKEEEYAQMEWMKKELDPYADSTVTGTIVFMHHPFFDNDIDEEDGYHSITKARRSFYLDIFAKGGVKAVFSGHRHTTIPERSYGDIRLINTNAICNSFDDTPGLRIVKLAGGVIEEEFVGRESIPESVDVG